MTWLFSFTVLLHGEPSSRIRLEFVRIEMDRTSSALPITMAFEFIYIYYPCIVEEIILSHERALS